MSVSIHSVGIVARAESAEALEAARDFGAALASRGVDLRVPPELGGEVKGAKVGDLDLVLGADLVIVLGGDGTLLAVAREAAPKGTLVLGVDLGSFGFLAEEDPAFALARVDELLAGDLATDERMMLEVSVRRGEEVVDSYLALNDAVVARTSYRHLARIHCEVGGSHLATYPADGVIVSTPTGSTAYNLSAGGPIIEPCVDCMVISAICPHTLYTRPLVIDPSSRIELWPEARLGRVDDICLTVDGQPPRHLVPDERVVIARACCRAKLVRMCRASFFDRLREKLNWGAPR